MVHVHTYVHMYIYTGKKRNHTQKIKVKIVLKNDGTLILRFLYNLKLDKENYSLWYISYWNPSLFLNNHFVAIDKNRIFLYRGES